MAQPYLSIIIPAYNEAERIPQTLIDMDKRLSLAPYSYEIIVVNDASTDNTLEIVNKFTKMVKNLRIMTVPNQGGKGGAVREGMLAATGQICLFTDADNSTSIDQFEQMMPFFKEGYSVVIASRAIADAKLDPPESLFRQVAGKGLNLVVQLLLLPGLWDTQCGFKAFTEDVAKSVFGMSRIGGWGFDVEVLALARKKGYRIKEVPVHWVNDTASHVKVSAGLQFLRDILRIRWWMWTGKY